MEKLGNVISSVAKFLAAALIVFVIIAVVLAFRCNLTNNLLHIEQAHTKQLKEDINILIEDSLTLAKTNEQLMSENKQLIGKCETLINIVKELRNETNETAVIEPKNEPDKTYLPNEPTNIFRCEPYTFTEGSQQAMLQEQCKTDPETGIRYYTDANGTKWYCAALAGAFGKEIGSGYIFNLANGLTLPVILSDFKHPINYIRDDDYGDTDQNYLGENCVCVIEFVVDMNVIPNSVKQAGTMSALPQFGGLYSHEGNIVDVKKCERVWKP